MYHFKVTLKRQLRKSQSLVKNRGVISLDAAMIEIDLLEVVAEASKIEVAATISLEEAEEEVIETLMWGETTKKKDTKIMIGVQAVGAIIERTPRVAEVGQETLQLQEEVVALVEAEALEKIEL